MAIFPVLGKPTHIYVCVGMSDVIASALTWETDPNIYEGRLIVVRERY